MKCPPKNYKNSLDIRENSVIINTVYFSAGFCDSVRSLFYNGKDDRRLSHNAL